MIFKKLKENYELYKSNYFVGDDLYCPFCSKFFRMDSFSKSGGKGTHCPICASSKEERTLLLFLQSRTELLSGNLKVLVISERNEITEYFKKYPNSEVKVIDPTGDFSIRDDEMKDKYPSNYFDVIICNYILEKLPSYFILMNEIKRVIKSDGFIVLQANIDEDRETTLETHVQTYKDRLKIYGILGNYRRFGKDYTKILKEDGLDVLEYNFELGLEDIPHESVYDKYKFYLGYKDDPPIIKDYNNILDEAIDVHHSVNLKKSSFYSMIYVLFFLIPDNIKRKMYDFGDRISEKRENKHRTEYMLFVLFTGMFLFWSTLVLYLWTGHFYDNYFVGGIIHWFVTFPMFITVGLAGLSMLHGYAYTYSGAGEIKRGIVGLFFSGSVFLSVIILIFGQ